MNVSKAEYEVLNNMTNDLMRAEEFINNLGVETRQGECDDEFRPINEILKDVVTVANNNPTIIKDTTGKPFDTSDESDEFLSKYNLSGITVAKTYMQE